MRRGERKGKRRDLRIIWEKEGAENASIINDENDEGRREAMLRVPAVFVEIGGFLRERYAHLVLRFSRDSISNCVCPIHALIRFHYKTQSVKDEAKN